MTSEDWPEIRLGDLVDERGISYGIVQPGSDCAGGVPIVRVNNLREGRVVTDDVKRVSPDIESKYGRTRLRGGEVLVSLVGSLGQTAIAPPTLQGWNVARAVAVVPVREDIGADWVAYVLRSPTLQHRMRTRATTTVQATLNLQDVRELPIPLPDRLERDRVTSALRALDDKIELNRRMNRTLESIARAIFKSWFVDFDPVHKKIKGGDVGLSPDLDARWPAEFTSSEMGPIPAGWRVRTLGDVADVVDCLHGKKPSRKEAGRPLLQLFNIRNDGLLDLDEMYLIEHEDYAHWTSRFEAMGGDCVITNVGRVGAVAQVPQGMRAALGRNMTGIRCKRSVPYPSWLIQMLLSKAMKDEIVRRTDTGTILEALNVRSIPRLRLVLPTTDLLAAYDAVSRPIRRQMEDRLRESATLAHVRTSLVPRLMSGRSLT